MREVLRLRSEIDQVMADALHVPWPRHTAAAARTPALDLCETEAQYLVRLDVPGVQRDKLSVSVSEDTLVVSGERPLLSLSEGAVVLRTERERGPFRRTLLLPPNADPGAVKARLADGVLAVQIGKRVPDSGRVVPIEAAD